MSQQPNAKPVIALIGTGMWGQNIARNLAHLGVLAGICDSEPDRAKHIADQHGVAVMSFDDILANSDIDGVALATPAPSHHDLAVATLEAGKHIYIEKPLALTLADADAIAKA
ncbi:MAG: gfo/Idh/MocA family oxidoreductase, partial [Alphaproteobacteria bacterium]|nr:gfo/Idh/MocA family oxidoreductase [Alphaproteobacteria bacterium]